MVNSFGIVESVEITVLVEDYAGYDSQMLAQHGVSFLLETKFEKGEKTILFDTGQSAEIILQNMERLGKDPDKIDLVFLSHCHSDHTGGLVGIINAVERNRIPIIAHPAVHRFNFGIKPSFRVFGMGPANSPEAIRQSGGEMVLTEDPLPLAPGILTTGEVKERVSFEENPTLSMFTLVNGKIVGDKMTDDISLVLILDQGLVIVTGCSHAGIISIIQSAKRITGINHITALIGGFHLIDADQQRINKTAEELLALSPGKIYTGHCTGLKAEAKLMHEFGSRFKKMRTGMTITF